MDANFDHTDPRSQSDLGYILSLSSWDEQIKTIVRWLTGKDARRTQLATGVLVRTGKSVTTHLVDEALAPRRREQHRVRLLQAVEQIGQPLDAADWFALLVAKPRYSPAVQEQIIRVFAVHLKASSGLQ